VFEMHLIEAQSCVADKSYV